MGNWLRDLGMGLRLAVGGSRTTKTGVVRLLMSTVGIGLAVFVLLVAVSAPHMLQQRSDRQSAFYPSSQTVPGVAPTIVINSSTYLRNKDVSVLYMRGTGPNSPVPSGVDRIPAVGEVMVSPALAEVLAGPDGPLIRPRLPGKVVGVIDRLAVTDPTKLAFYAGSDVPEDAPSAQLAYEFGFEETNHETDPGLLTAIAVGVVALLMPVLVFVAVSSRIAGAERDRRLAALRLVGADRRQVTRIAAAESLAGSATGLVLGIGLFVLFRALIEHLTLIDLAFYSEDVAPPWLAVALVILVVPGIAVGTSLASMRRTVIEPLGVVRRAPKVNRRLWWRLIPPAMGVALILFFGKSSPYSVAAGAVLLLLGIPVLLPWLLDRGLGRFGGGSPAWQLAVRRLQLDTGTAARVVAGLAVVLAGAIATQGVLAAEASHYGVEVDTSLDQSVPDLLTIAPDSDVAGQALQLTRGVSGVRSATGLTAFYVETEDKNSYDAVIADCAAIRQHLQVSNCHDGDSFLPQGGVPNGGPSSVAADGALMLADESETPWRVPANAKPAQRVQRTDAAATSWDYSALVVTPAVMRGLHPETYSSITAMLEPGSPDVQDRVRNALAPLAWRVYVTKVQSDRLSDDQASFLVVRNGLLGGSLFTLLLAGVSLLVVALEQMRERRKAIAALAATGVPTRTLARSVMLQTAIPVLAGVAVAVVTGLGLSALVLPLFREQFTVDWGAVGILSAAAAVLVVAVTGLTLPSLRGAARLDALRSE